MQLLYLGICSTSNKKEEGYKTSTATKADRTHTFKEEKIRWDIGDKD